MKQVVPTAKENQVLAKLAPDYLEFSEMKNSEREFLNALLLRHRPKTVVEVGVSAGSSSVIILNALTKLPRAKLYSIDLDKNYYRQPQHKAGFIVDKYPELKKHWHLHTGNFACHYLPKLKDKIDFCFIDTAHCVPGEILDTLMVLPFMRKGGVIVYHDINIQTMIINKDNYSRQHSIANNVIMSAMTGEKFLPATFETKNVERLGNYQHQVTHHFPNIGAVVLNYNNYQERAWELFNLLALPWKYAITDKQVKQLTKFFESYYQEALVEMFNRAATHWNKYQQLHPKQEYSPTEIKFRQFMHRLFTYKRNLFK